MRISTRITASVLLISVLISLVACSGVGNILGNFDTELEEDKLHENIIGGNTITENIVSGSIMTTDEISENKIKAIQLIEEYIPEDIIVENIKVDIVRAEDMKGLLDSYFAYESLYYNIDYSTVGAFLAKAAVATVVNIVAATKTGDTVGIVIAIAGTLVGAAIGATVGALMAAYNTDGNSAVMKKYAVEYMASGAYLGAVAVGLASAYKGTSATAPGTKLSVSTVGKEMVGTVTKAMDVVNEFGEVTGYVAEGGVVLNFGGDVLGKLGPDGSITESIQSLIPKDGKILDALGNTKYLVGKDNKVTDAAGKLVGKINDAGMIFNPVGRILGMVNALGILNPGVTATLNAGFDIGLSGVIKNSSYDNGKYTYYLDENGNVMGALVKTVNSVGEEVGYLLEKIDESVGDALPDVADAVFGEGAGAIVGMVNKFGQLVSDWENYYRVERLAAVSTAWEQEREMVEKTGVGTREWTEEEKSELLETGKVAGFEAHYINSPKNNPTLLYNPDNIVFFSPEEHVEALNNYKTGTPTYGDLIDRTM